jgi:hypothetical protein
MIPPKTFFPQHFVYPNTITFSLDMAINGLHELFKKSLWGFLPLLTARFA